MTNSGIISSIRPSGSRHEQRRVLGSDPSDPYLRSPAFYSFLEAFRAFRKFAFQATNLSCAIGARPRSVLVIALSVSSLWLGECVLSLRLRQNSFGTNVSYVHKTNPAPHRNLSGESRSVL